MPTCLLARIGGEVFLLEPGANRAGPDLPLSRHAARGRWRQFAQTNALGPGGGGCGAFAAGRPRRTANACAVLANRAYAIDKRPLSLGSQPDGSSRWIDLQDTMPGVSRQHCSLQLDNGQCVVRDFSRYGTFLNGHAIDGSAVLQVGDLIRLGTPGFELRLITTESSGGS